MHRVWDELIVEFIEEEKDDEKHLFGGVWVEPCSFFRTLIGFELVQPSVQMDVFLSQRIEAHAVFVVDTLLIQ